MVKISEICEENLGLVWAVINNEFKTYNDDKQEMFQDGVVGLLKAINNYDSERGKLSSYAYNIIAQSIKAGIELRNNGVHYTNQGLKIKEYIYKYMDEVDSIEELCEKIHNETNLQVDKEIIANTYYSMLPTVSAMNKSKKNDENEEEYIINIIPSNEEEIGMNIIAHEDSRLLYDTIYTVLSKEREQTRAVYEKWMVQTASPNGCKITDLAEECGLTKQRVSAIVKDINTKIARKLQVVGINLDSFIGIVE